MLTEPHHDRVQLGMADPGFTIREQQVHLVQHEVEILPRLGNQAEKGIESFIGIFLGSGDPYEEIQMFQELQHLFPMPAQETVKVGKIAEQNMANGVGGVGDFAPRLGTPGESLRQGHRRMMIDQHLLGVRAAMAGGGNGRSGQSVHQGGLTHPGAPEEPDHQRACGNGLELAGQFEGIFKKPLFFLTG